MAAPIEVDTRNNSVEELCQINCTVTTGFESVARNEAQNTIGIDVQAGRGHILMKIPIKNVNKIHDLGCIDNCSVVMTKIKDFPFSDEVTSMTRLRNLVLDVNWSNGLKVWHRVFSFSHPIKDVPDIIPESLGPIMLSDDLPAKQKSKNKGKGRSKNAAPKFTVDVKTDMPEGVKFEKLDNVQRGEDGDKATPETPSMDSSIAGNTDEETTASKDEPTTRIKQTAHNPDMPSFRVTCNRTGDRHNFCSMLAAANFGGAVQEYFKWNVDMKNFDVEVILNIDNKDVSVCLALTKGSLHNRNLSSFGPTTLRPTIAHNMLRMCEIKTGEVVCDPMCGSGSIPIEAAIRWPEAVHLCGELAEPGVNRTKENLSLLNEKRSEQGRSPVNLSIFKWDACNLPLADNSVDVFVTDLPFGKRMGHKVENWRLYPSVMREMARVAKPNTGRACLLTMDKKCMTKIMSQLLRFWKRQTTLWINIGGLSAGVYLFHRTGHGFGSQQSASTTTAEDAASSDSGSVDTSNFTVLREVIRKLDEQ